MPILHLTGSRVKIYRPKTAWKHVSIVESCPALSNVAGNVTVKILLEGFDSTPHTHTCNLRVGLTDVAPASTVTVLKDALAKRYEKTLTFNAAAGTTNFRIVQTGTTNSAQSTYHVSERTYYTK
jgi:hypothetical protein